MPDGMVLWFDPKTDEAEIMRGGRSFTARGADLEPVARRAGARVHFDVQRLRGGEERAVKVRLREGTRVSNGQRRFGTLAGARRADSKGPLPYADVHPELRDATDHPLEVTRSWAKSLSRGDVAGAVSLYAPDASLHLGQASRMGRSAVRTWLEQSPALGSGRSGVVRGRGPTALVVWEATSPDDTELVVESRIAHGRIAEQWVRPSGLPDSLMREGPAVELDVAVATRGDVRQDAKTRARQKILQVLSKLDQPVLFAEVKLAFEADPARDRPAVAQVAVDLDGELVRAHVFAHALPEAIDLLADRLTGQLAHRAAHRKKEHRGTGEPAPGAWRHRDLPTSRPPYFDRPVEERQVIRRKSFASDELTPDEAVAEMEQLGQDFYLFRDLATGIDTVVERIGDDAYRLSGVRPLMVEITLAAGRLEVVQVPAPVLNLSDAVERLNSGGERALFFADAAAGRGNLLYRRYDGHYGLIALE